MTRLLGGTASPIGWSVQYLDAPMDVVRDAIQSLRRGTRLKLEGPRPFPQVLQLLPPFEVPWTRELIVPCGAWTAYLNNGLHGGDDTAIGMAVSRDLGVRCVVATHTPRYGPGHESTQLWILGPDGEPPLMFQRTVAAHAEDGRWRWLTSGQVQPFEEPSRYRVRRIRDRFDRPLLIQYLAALGIPADDDNAYGSGMIIQQKVRWKRRSVSLAHAKADLSS